MGLFPGLPFGNRISDLETQLVAARYDHDVALRKLNESNTTIHDLNKEVEYLRDRIRDLRGRFLSVSKEVLSERARAKQRDLDLAAMTTLYEAQHKTLLQLEKELADLRATKRDPFSVRYMHPADHFGPESVRQEFGAFLRDAYSIAQSQKIVRLEEELANMSTHTKTSDTIYGLSPQEFLERRVSNAEYFLSQSEKERDRLTAMCREKDERILRYKRKFYQYQTYEQDAAQ